MSNSAHLPNKGLLNQLLCDHFQRMARLGTYNTQPPSYCLIAPKRSEWRNQGCKAEASARYGGSLKVLDDDRRIARIFLEIDKYYANTGLIEPEGYLSWVGGHTTHNTILNALASALMAPNRQLGATNTQTLSWRLFLA